MQATTLSHVTPTRLSFNPKTTFEFLARHATDALNPEFEVSVKRLIACWANLHQHQIVVSETSTRPFKVEDAAGCLCPMHTQRFTDTLEVLARNWQKYLHMPERELIGFIRRFEITSFAELDFGEPLRLEPAPALAAD